MGLFGINRGNPVKGSLPRDERFVAYDRDYALLSPYPTKVVGGKNMYVVPDDVSMDNSFVPMTASSYQGGSGSFVKGSTYYHLPKPEGYVPLGTGRVMKDSGLLVKKGQPIRDVINYKRPNDDLYAKYNKFYVPNQGVNAGGKLYTWGRRGFDQGKDVSSSFSHASDVKSFDDTISWDNYNRSVYEANK